MKSFVYFLVIAVLLLTLSSFLIQDAHATTFELQVGNGNGACGAIGGTWNGIDTCTVTSLTINPGDDLTIDSGVILVISSGTGGTGGNAGAGGAGGVGGDGGTDTIPGDHANGGSANGGNGGFANGGSANGELNNNAGTITISGTIQINGGTGGDAGTSNNGGDGGTGGNGGTAVPGSFANGGSANGGNSGSANGGSANGELNNNAGGIVNIQNGGSIVVTGGTGGNGGIASNGGNGGTGGNSGTGGGSTAGGSANGGNSGSANGGSANGELNNNAGGIVNIQNGGSIVVKDGIAGNDGTAGAAGNPGVAGTGSAGGTVNGGAGGSANGGTATGEINNAGTINKECSAIVNNLGTFSGNSIENLCLLITAPLDKTVIANTAGGWSGSIGTATTSGGFAPITVTNNAPAKFPLGITIVTWTAMDSSTPTHQTAFATQKITVSSIVMSDTTASFASLVSSPRQFMGELATPTSVLLGKQIDSITLKLQKVGSPTGTAQVGIFDINRNVVRLFGTINVSTISTTAKDYEFKLLTSDPLYTIKSGDRIGIKYTGGSSTVGVNVTPDRDDSDPFDGSHSYRVRYETAWVSSTMEDMYMILKQTHDDTSSSTFPLLQMSDTTASFDSLISSSRPFIGEYASPTSSLVGKKIDSISLRLSKVGAPTGTAQVGIFDINRNVVKLFGTIDVSTIATTDTVYEFKLPFTDPLYVIASGDRIGIKYTGGSSSVGVNVTPDRVAGDPFDGTNSYRVRYESAWITSSSEDMYMILKQTHGV